jgi:hypothetical protein
MNRSAHPAFVRYPDAARFGRKYPKNRFYEHGHVNTRLKNLFVKQVGEIFWQYKLAPDTVNLPVTRNVREIQVFVLRLKESELSREVLRCMDLAVPYPLVFELVRKLEAREERQVVAACKRPSEADANRWVTSDYFATEWLPVDCPRAPMPVALHMGGLYEQLLHRLIPLPARPRETLAELVARTEQAQAKQRELDKMTTRLAKEKQFNRKVEINAAVRRLRTELEEIKR